MYTLYTCIHFINCMIYRCIHVYLYTYIDAYMNTCLYQGKEHLVVDCVPSIQQTAVCNLMSEYFHLQYIVDMVRQAIMELSASLA